MVNGDLLKTLKKTSSVYKAKKANLNNVLTEKAFLVKLLTLNECLDQLLC